MALTASRIEKRRLQQGTGLETLVDLTAFAILILGVIISCVMLFSFSLWGLLSAMSTLVGAFVQWLLFRCLAEHLRLQKKIAGHEFEGRITGPSAENTWTCGNCGQLLHSHNRCDSCGAEIIQEDH